MSEQFSILIDSRTRFETGEPGGVWLSMPTTKEQLHEAMQRVGITADNPQNFFINGFANTEQQPFDVPLPVIQSAGLDELNYLGNLLAMQRDEDRDKFTAAVALGERAGSVKDLINLAQNLDCYWLYPTVQNEEDYGYYLIDELDELELPEEAKKYFMYEDYGRDAAINDGGRFTEQGYIYVFEFVFALIAVDCGKIENEHEFSSREIIILLEVHCNPFAIDIWLQKKQKNPRLQEPRILRGSYFDVMVGKLARYFRRSAYSFV